jgi:hypothetical protein
MFSYNISIKLSVDAITATIVILSFEIFWCTLLNLGYAYRNSIRSLMQGEEKIKVGKFPKINLNIRKTLYLVLYFGGFISIYLIKENLNTLFLLGAIGLVGLSGCIKNIIIPYINQMIINKWSSDSIKIVYMGFLRKDLKILKNNIFILITSSILLLSLMAMSITSYIETGLCLLSYIVMSLLLSLSLMFSLSSDLNDRNKYFVSLMKIGYLKSQLLIVIRKELLYLYGFILIASLLYICNILMFLLIHHYISLILSIIIILVFVCPLLLCGLINYLY